MIKDVGARLAIMGHYLRDARHMYPVMRHQNIRVYRGMLPWTQDAGFIAPSAFVCGNVVLGHDTTIFYHTVIRNYNSNEATRIGDHSVVMDRATLMGQVRVGQGVYVGCGASLDCCDVHDNVYIGPGATVALGAVVESNAIVAAGAVVPKDARVYSGELWAGNPAVKVADVTPEQTNEIHHLLHDQVAAGHAHIKAIHHHEEHNSELSGEWLREAIQLMEAQHKQMSVKIPVDIPLEARRFLVPRVYMRRPEMHLRSSYPVNRMAPWMPKIADQTSNV
ncbi:gamma carbonic dehydratase [Strigomonas culicis]|nr:gamma carbonic dehydratase [Strigomonas culicis]|eukprot:EPY36188.1 gamma carbonic dehydratase [Strigomonas culicis]